jgi:hypothetical protein
MLARLIPAAELFEVPGATHWTTAFADAAVARAASWIAAHAAVPA